MTLEAFEVLAVGLGLTLQDRGRMRWRRYGVPPGGVMDDHAALWANRLLDNPFDAPVLELLLQGAKLRVLADTWVAITGAEAEPNLPMWKPFSIQQGEVLTFPRNQSGVWTYLAIEGGFQGRRWLGSVSAYPRAQLGHACQTGEVLQRTQTRNFQLPPGVADRWLAPSERRDYHRPPVLRVWPGPQWELFAESTRQSLFEQTWTVTGQSDRVGYRLSGTPLFGAVPEIISEPVRMGSIQVPENGQPLVTMRDGPTVGGYPKLGMVDPSDLSWLAQCRPGQTVSFRLHEAGPKL